MAEEIYRCDDCCCLVLDADRVEHGEFHYAKRDMVALPSVTRYKKVGTLG